LPFFNTLECRKDLCDDEVAVDLCGVKQPNEKGLYTYCGIFESFLDEAGLRAERLHHDYDDCGQTVRHALRGLGFERRD
jgi:hypothetical protein